MSDRLSWEAYGLRLAATAAERSEDPYVKVGTCLLRPDNTVAALGYNGAPPGVEVDWSDRDGRRDWVIHAEANALRYVTPGEVAIMATTMMPCERCILLVAAYKIPVVVYRDALTENYDETKIREIARACGIEVAAWPAPETARRVAKPSCDAQSERWGQESHGHGRLVRYACSRSRGHRGDHAARHVCNDGRFVTLRKPTLLWWSGTI